MKAIVLTPAPIEPEDVQPLLDTKIHKYAINGHAEWLKPDYRICSDYGVIGYLLEYFTQTIITTREYAKNSRLIYAGEIPFRGSTMTACLDYLVSKGYKQILIIGNNTVHEQFFQDRINSEIKRILEDNSDVKIFQYSKGNFNLPVMSVQQFVKERK